MRALILRRVGLIETGVGGPVIVGRAGNGDVLRLRGLPAPQRPSAPALDPGHRSLRAQALIERFHIDADRAADRAVPERRAAAQSRARASSPAASAWSARSTRASSTTWPSSAPVRPVSRPRSTRRRRGCRCSCSTAAPSAARRAPRRASRTTSAFRPASRGMALMARAYNQAQKFGAEMAIPDEVVRLAVRADARRRASCSSLGERRAASRARRGDRQRRALPPARRREPRRVRGRERALLGLAAGGAAVRRRRRWRWSARGNSAGQAAVYLASQAREGLAARARREPRGEHVALSGRPHRGAAQRRGADRRPRSSALEGEDGSARGDPLAHRGERRGDDARRSATSSCSSAPIPTPTGWRARGVALDARASCCTGARRRPARRRSRPAAAASSPSATCAPARSSASPRRSAKARRSSRRCTPSWRDAARAAEAPLHGEEI